MSASVIKRIVRNEPLKMTPARRKRFARIAAIKDSDIDFSDIPEVTSFEGWTRPGALIPAENKQQVTLRLDADVLGFFKKTGRRYQTRINAVLREYVMSQKKSA